MASPDALVRLPSVAEYVSAFAALDAQSQITEKQHEMLAYHHRQPGRTVSATTLAHAVGYSGYESANSQYGRLGALVASEIGLTLRSVQVGVLVDFVYPDQAANDQFLWMMREHVAVALEELGWVPKVSQYLYPDAAIEAGVTRED